MGQADFVTEFGVTSCAMALSHAPYCVRSLCAWAGIRANMQQFGIPDAEINSYIAARPYEGLPSIYTELRVALFLNGNEAWSLVRRTEQPALTPSVGDRIPNRLSMSPNEALYNPDNYVPTS